MRIKEILFNSALYKHICLKVVPINKENIAPLDTLTKIYEKQYT